MENARFKEVSKKEVIQFFENDTNRRTVHNISRLDFNNISAAFIGSGSFTARSINNALKERGVIENSLVFVKVEEDHKFKPDFYCSKGIYTYYVTASCPSVRGYKLRAWSRSSIELETFWAKYDYEALRKYAKKDYLVISAPGLRYYEDVRNAEKALPIFSGVRYEFDPNRSNYFREAGITNRPFREYKNSWRRSSAENVKIDFDKSGYYVRKNREALQVRAHDIRVEKQKNEFLQADYSAKIRDIETRINSIRSLSASALLDAKTYDEMKRIEDAFDSWRGIPSIMRSFENFQNAIASKKYSSTKEAESYYDVIIKDCEKVESILSVG